MRGAKGAFQQLSVPRVLYRCLDFLPRATRCSPQSISPGGQLLLLYVLECKVHRRYLGHHSGRLCRRAPDREIRKPSAQEDFPSLQPVMQYRAPSDLQVPELS